ncbi:phage head morphogenesis protein [Citrobacter freundii]|uniref:phage head morphogenesis protein n=1 Tax=Citrobacter freundii complex TaxID=1344959 RepID=UPI000537CDE5|nr:MULTISPECIES: phage head morphogenesis protein [Citrobacter freundii complex]EJR7284408.1 phage head morphogenesis protein [Citrobacter freundii]EKT9243961.1 phage head morphogenesis protein [Citrobacter freundii]EKW8511669.1 phage head morphogenesis protein [Citrobacter freundii]ELO0986294.1 phage head morphogenesis protein [Citrobacter freundii]ELO1021735.1 phage head morphogenesis protein [Citrobacter freundii]
MAQAVDLAYAARLPPKEAVAYFRAKGHNITWNWYEQLTEAHARAFTVAKAVRLDVLNTIRDEVDRAVHDGITRQEFTRTLAPRLQKLGWWGKQIVVDTQGNAKEIELGSPRRLATIYNVNMRTAYNSGRYAQMMNNAEAYPFWQYVAVMDGRTRPAHAALNGMVFRYDDPFWQTHYPPNGWSCRCRVRALSAERMKALGLKVSYGASFVHTHEVDAGIDETTGEIFRTDSTTFDNGRVKMTPDVGWSYNPGSAAFGTDQTLIRKLVETKDAQLREQVVQSLNNSRERQLAFSVWAKRVLTTRRAGNAVQTLGFMTESVADAVRQRTGNTPSRLLVISEKNLLHTDSSKHQRTGVALTADDLQLLPSLMAAPQAVLWDKVHSNLIYLVSAREGTAKVVVNAPYALKRQADLLDVLINAYRLPDVGPLKAAVAGGNMDVLEGHLD